MFADAIASIGLRRTLSFAVVTTAIAAVVVAVVYLGGLSWTTTDSPASGVLEPSSPLLTTTPDVVTSTGLGLYLALNQDYKFDREIGSLVRTRDFRRAVAHALDRESIAATIYGADADFSPVGLEYDPEKARGLVERMSYHDTDGDGFVNRLDGRGNLELFLGGVGQDGLAEGSTALKVAAHIQKDLAEVGVQLNVRLGHDGSDALDKGKQYLSLGTARCSEGLGTPWTGSTRWIAPEVARLYHGDGSVGMKASGPDPNWTDVYGNDAPERIVLSTNSVDYSPTYPSDISGNLMRLQALHELADALDLTEGDWRIDEIAGQIEEIYTLEQYAIAITCPVPSGG